MRKRREKKKRKRKRRESCSLESTIEFPRGDTRAERSASKWLHARKKRNGFLRMESRDNRPRMTPIYSPARDLSPEIIANFLGELSMMRFARLIAIFLLVCLIKAVVIRDREESWTMMIFRFVRKLRNEIAFVCI